MIHNDATAEDRGRPGDLRGARRRRAADVRAGERCCRWRSAISCSDRASRCLTHPRAPQAPHATQRVPTCRPLVLPFELRQKSRLRTRARARRGVGLMLAAAPCCAAATSCAPTTDASCAWCAADEALSRSRCARRRDARALRLPPRQPAHAGRRSATAALRITADHVLDDMVRGLGASVAPMRAPFEPEAGAYAGGHHHHSGDAKHERHHPRH